VKESIDRDLGSLVEEPRFQGSHRGEKGIDPLSPGHPSRLDHNLKGGRQGASAIAQARRQACTHVAWRERSPRVGDSSRGSHPCEEATKTDGNDPCVCGIHDVAGTTVGEWKKQGCRTEGAFHPSIDSKARFPYTRRSKTWPAPYISERDNGQSKHLGKRDHNQARETTFPPSCFWRWDFQGTRCIPRGEENGGDRHSSIR